MLLDLQTLGLSFTYKKRNNKIVQGTTLDDEALDLLKPILPFIKVNKAPLDFASFKDHYNIYRLVRFKFEHPIPPIKYILPYVMAHWNPRKGGSDTISKMVWNCQFRPPSNHAQATVSGQTLLFMANLGLRLLQIASAKEDLQQHYRDIEHYRNAAGRRIICVASFTRQTKLWPQYLMPSTADRYQQALLL